MSSNNTTPPTLLANLELIMSALLLGLAILAAAIVHQYAARIKRRNRSPRQQGIEILVPAEDAEMDIVAVHGLGAHPEYTWTARAPVSRPSQEYTNSRVNWLRDKEYLQTDFSTARIMVFGHNADWFVNAPTITAQETAGTLLRELKKVREGHKRPRPILLIGHSFGGIIIKQAICCSKMEDEFQDIHNAICGVIFLGTPHQGSDVSLLGSVMASATTPLFGSNKMLLKSLRKHDARLADLQHNFFKSISERAVLYSFYETMPTCLFNYIPVGLIVDRDSGSLASAKNIPIWRDHSGLNKCLSRDDQVYKEICNAIRDIRRRAGALGPGGSNWTTQALNTGEIEANKQCLSDLRLTDPRHDKKRIEESKDHLLEGSYAWILENPDFLRWRVNDDTRLLWIAGDPGKGKTMLMIALVDELSGRFKTKSDCGSDSRVGTGSAIDLETKSDKPEAKLNIRPETRQDIKSETEPGPFVLSYFFCQSPDPNLNNAVSVLRGLIYLLVDEHKLSISYLRKSYDSAGSKLFEGPNALYALWTILLDMLNNSSLPKVYLMVDALDECESGLFKLLRLIAHTPEPSSRVKWLVSSRNRPDIEEQLRPDGLSSKISLELNSSYVTRAVTAFINFKVSNLAERKGYKSDLQDEVKGQLERKAEGTFLWVALVCKELEEVHARKTLSVLKELPLGLEPLYKRMMEKIRHLKDLEDVEFCTRILSSVTLAYRPLHLKEIAAIAGLPEVFFDEPQSSKELVDQCGSFLTVRGETIYFVHQSAKDYLTRSGSGIFHSSQAEEHRKITCRSLQLMSDTLKRDICGLRMPGALLKELNRVNQDPLARIRYACCYWIPHLRDAGHFQHDQVGLCDGGKVHTFLQGHLLHWLEALSLMGNVSDGAIMVKILEEMLMLKPNTNSLLLAMIHDAKRFILRFGSIIEEAPLQTYCAALAFSPWKSEIRRQFWNQRHPRIKRVLHAEETWSPSRTLEGHLDWVKSVAFSPDGKLVASGSGDKRVRLWDASTGAARGTLEGHSDWVLSVAFSPDGKLVASGSNDKTVRLWDAGTGAARGTLEDHLDSVTSVAFSPDSKLVASGSRDYIVRLWDASTRAARGTLQGHSHWVTSVAFSPNGKLVVSGSRDKTVRLWDTGTGAARGTLEDHLDWVTSVAFSPDSKLVASGSRDYTVRLWDASTGAARGTLEDHSSPVWSVAFSPDSKLVATGSNDKTVRLWDTSTGAARGTLKGHLDSVSSVAFSPADGNLVASGSDDNTVRLWDAGTGAARGTLEGHSLSVLSVAFSPLDGKLVASSSADNTVRLWDSSTGAARGTLEGHSSPVTSVVFSPDGKLVASGSDDKRVRLWDANTGAARGTLEGHLSWVTSVAFSPNGKLVVSGSGDKTVRLWDASTGAAQSILEGHLDCVRSVAFSPDSKLVASGSRDNTVRLWDASTGAVRGTLEGHSHWVTSVAFSPDGKLVASGSNDETVRLWDASTGAERGTLEGYSDWVTSVSFSPDGKLVASGSRDKTVRLWDIGTGALRGTLSVDAVIRNLSFSSSGQYLKTDRGVLDLGSLFPNVSSYSSNCWLPLFVSDNWVAVEEEGIIWLPSDYRATCVAAQNGIVVLGHLSGGVTFLDFELGKMTL